MPSYQIASALAAGAVSLSVLLLPLGTQAASSFDPAPNATLRTDQPARAPAQERERQHIQLAGANFEEVDASGCIRTFFDAIGRDATSSSGASGSGMLVTYSVEDQCAGARVSFSQGIVPLQTNDLSFSPNGRYASLDAEVLLPVNDEHGPTGAMRHIVIALDWAADAKAEVSVVRSDPPGPMKDYVSRVSVRPARASGTVIVDGVTVVPGLPADPSLTFISEEVRTQWTIP
jgi:hypothetical protein